MAIAVRSVATGSQAKPEWPLLWSEGMDSIKFSACLFFGAAFSSGLCARAKSEDQELTVKLVSGREFSAQVDSRTGERLWLRFSSSVGSVLRPIAWERVASAQVNGKNIELAELRQTCLDMKTASPRPQELPAPVTVLRPTPIPATTVSSIRIEAWLANWDADVETDGLVVQLTPLDEIGQAVAISGTAEVELFAARQRKFHEAPQSGGWMTELMQRWSENLEPEQLGASGMLLRLPFTAVHPEFDRGVDGMGLVHVRLTVPGSGVFEQSLDGVRLRNWSPVRDGMYLQNGRRFFSTEQMGRH
jgi:hypothetical protein